MKVKLDENIGQSVRRRLTDTGHDVSTIVDQDMTGAPDEVIYQTCAAAVVDQLVGVAADRDVDKALWIISVRGVRRFVPPES